MMAKEEYKKELVRMWDSVRDDKFKGRNNCDGVICSECQFCDINDNDCYTSINAVEMVEVVEKWSKEHPKPRYRVSQMEYDVLLSAIEHSCTEVIFDDFPMLCDLLKKGYFDGATSRTNVGDYFDNCEIIKIIRKGENKNGN